MRVPPTLTPDLQQALREIWQRIDRQSGPNSVDLHGRRFLNAGGAIEGQEYITREEVERLLAGETAGTIFSGAGGGTAAPTTPTTIPLPETPSSPVPATGGTGVSLSPTLVWTGADATGFHVYFGTGATPTLVSTNQPGTTYTPAGPLTANTTYTWKIVGVNAIGSTAGPLWTFTTEVAATAPDTPSLPSPADNATSVAVLPKLNWTAARATSHTVYFGNSLFNYTCAMEQPNGTATAPIVARDCWFGYFFSIALAYPAAPPNAYGEYIGAPENFVVVHDAPSLTQALAKGKWVVIKGTAELAAAVSGYEDRVIGIYLESNVSASDLATKAAEWVTSFCPAGLTSVPVWGTCDGWMPTASIANVDWLGLECYTLTTETAAVCRARVEAVISAGTWDVGQQFFLIGLSYTSNLTHTQDTQTLIDSQSIPAAIARANADIAAIVMFSNLRATGTADGHETDWRPIHWEIFDGIRYRDYGFANYTCPDERDMLTPTDRAGPAWSTCPDERTLGYSADCGAATPPALAYTAINSPPWSPPRLAPAQTYLWNVVASNSIGSTTGPAWDFTTTTPTGSVPGTPSLPFPSHRSTVSTLTVTLAWSSTGATKYDVYFGTTTTPGLFRIGTSRSESALPTLTAGTTYYWQIVAINAIGSTTGALWSFTTAGATGPDTPATPYPADGATNVPIDVVLSWAATSRADWYTIGIGTVFPPTPDLYPNPTNPTRLTEPRFAPPDWLELSTTYYWYVQAWNLNGRSTGAVWSFTTAATQTVKPTAPASHLVTVSGTAFRDATQTVWKWHGATYFGMFKNYLDSVSLQTAYDWATETGVNLFRVLMMKDPTGMPSKIPWTLAPGDYTDTQLRNFLTAVTDEGFYVQVVALADCAAGTGWTGLPTTATQQAHLDRIVAVCDEYDQVFTQVANEPYVNAVNPSALSCEGGVWIDKGAGDGLPYLPVWHYVTEHSPRNGTWATGAANILKYTRLGYSNATNTETFPPLGVPGIENEPIGIAEANETDRRTNDAQMCADYFALADLVGAGATIHTDCLGLKNIVPTAAVYPYTVACCHAIRDVWAAGIPTSAQLGVYADHLMPSTCPVTLDTGMAAGIYAMMLGNKATVVIVGKPAASVAVGRNGWTVKATGGYNANIVFLEK